MCGRQSSEWLSTTTKTMKVMPKPPVALVATTMPTNESKNLS